MLILFKSIFLVKRDGTGYRCKAKHFKLIISSVKNEIHLPKKMGSNAFTHNIYIIPHEALMISFDFMLIALNGIAGSTNKMYS